MFYVGRAGLCDAGVYRSVATYVVLYPKKKQVSLLSEAQRLKTYIAIVLTKNFEKFTIPKHIEGMYKIHITLP